MGFVFSLMINFDPLSSSPRDQPDPIQASPRSPEPEVTREEIEQEEKQEETTGTSELPPGVTSDVLREASGAIDTFGEQTVSAKLS